MKVLLLHSGALGDTVLAVQVARRFQPDSARSQVSVAARSSIVAWTARRGWIDHALRLDDPRLLALFQTDRDPSPTCTFLTRFDLVVSFFGSGQATQAARLYKGSHTDVLSIDPAPSGETLSRGVHITDQWSADLALQGLFCHSANRQPTEAHPPRKTDGSGKLRPHLGLTSNSRVLLCHPGSGGLEKCCPTEFLIRLMTRARTLPIHPVWIVGPDEMERFGADYAKNLYRSAPVLFEEDVAVAADWVADADAYVGNDAGMTHVASAAGVPTLAIFGPTDPRVWRPLGPMVRIVRFPSQEESADDWVDDAVIALRELLVGSSIAL